MDLAELSVVSLTQCGSVSLCIGCAGFEPWRCWVEISCCVLQFAVARRPFVETRVSSSGETWQAKLIEILIISAAQGWAVVVFWKL